MTETAATETPATETPNAQPPAPIEAAKPAEPAKEAPKPPPTVKDWSAVTIAEKRITKGNQALEAKAKDIAAREAAVEAKAEQYRQEGLQALKKAYESKDYSRIEAEFPDLYKQLTQDKLRNAKRPGAAPPAPAPTKAEIIAEIRAEEKAEREKGQQAAQEEYRVNLENTLVTSVRADVSKFPLLAIEIEESPDLIRQWLHGMDDRTIKKSDGSAFSTMGEAMAEMEARFQARSQRRATALGLAGQPAPKTPSGSSPGDTAGKVNESGGPTTLTGRLSQESALPASPGSSSAAPQVATDYVSQMRARQEREAAELERATAEFVARRK